MPKVLLGAASINFHRKGSALSFGLEYYYTVHLLGDEGSRSLDLLKLEVR